MLENGSNACSCRKKKCVRHGKCNECIEYHKVKNHLPYCKRTKRSFLGFLTGKNKWFLLFISRSCSII